MNGRLGLREQGGGARAGGGRGGGARPHEEHGANRGRGRKPGGRGPAKGAPVRLLPALPRLPAISILSILALSGCGLLFEEDAQLRPAPTPGAEPISGEELPIGLGTLRQAEISVHVRRGDLEMSITPLSESVIRVTAPDTYERLSALAGGHQRIFRERTGSALAFQLFLVAVHSEANPVAFEPQGLTLVNRGLRYRPVEVRPVTPGWDRNRVEPRETLLAVYAFPPEVDLEGSLEVEYQEVRVREWDSILRRIQAERARIGAR